MCGIQARRAPRKAIFIWPAAAPFFQYNKRRLRQKTGGACLYIRPRMRMVTAVTYNINTK